MDNVEKIVYTVGGLAIVFCIYMLIRNKWVYNVRTDLIDYDSKIHDRLPSYDAMMWDLTSFDVKKMIEKEEQRKLKFDEMYRGLKPVKE